MVYLSYACIVFILNRVKWGGLNLENWESNSIQLCSSVSPFWVSHCLKIPEPYSSPTKAKFPPFLCVQAIWIIANLCYVCTRALQRWVLQPVWGPGLLQALLTLRLQMVPASCFTDDCHSQTAITFASSTVRVQESQEWSFWWAKTAKINTNEERLPLWPSPVDGYLILTTLPVICLAKTKQKQKENMEKEY